MNDKIMYSLDRWLRELDANPSPRWYPRGTPGDTPVRWFEEVWDDGYCETCSYEYSVVGVEYADGTKCAVEATFAEIINNLT